MKSKKGLIITAIAATLIVVLTISVVVVYRTVFQTPEVKLLKGIANTVSEITSYNSIYSQDKQMKIVQEKLENKPISFDSLINLTVGDADTIGIDSYTDYDYEKKKMQSKLELSIFNIDLITAYLKADQNKLFFSVPEYIEDTYFVNTDRIGEEFNQSVWSSLFYTQLPKEFMLNLFPEKDFRDSKESEEDVSEIEELWKKIQDEMVIENCEDPVIVKRDGKDMTCYGVMISFPGETLNLLLQKYSTVTVKNQINICLYFDNKNRIVCMRTPEKLAIEGSYFDSVAFDIEFNGSKRTLDKCKGSFVIGNSEEAFTIEVERRVEETNREFNDSYQMGISDSDSDATIDMTCFVNWEKENQEFSVNASMYTDLDSYNLLAEGSIEADEADTNINLQIGNLEYIENDNRIWKVTGSFHVSLFENEMDIPKEGIEFFQMTETDAVNLVEEIYFTYLRGASGF